jgi:hypothetical protein
MTLRKPAGARGICGTSVALSVDQFSELVGVPRAFGVGHLRFHSLVNSIVIKPMRAVQ